MFVIYLKGEKEIHGENCEILNLNEYSNYEMRYIHNGKLKTRYVSNEDVLCIFSDEEKGKDYFYNVISKNFNGKVMFATDNTYKLS